MFRFPLSALRKAGLFLLILLFLLAGLNHFNNPELYIAAIPPYLPLHSELSYIAGVSEIVGAIGLIFAQTRKVAGYFLVALLIAIYPANVHMALNPEHFPNCVPLLIYLRLPLHFLFIAWVYWASLREKAIG